LDNSNADAKSYNEKIKENENDRYDETRNDDDADDNGDDDLVV
jgi:hypothetical protein